MEKSEMLHRYYECLAERDADGLRALLTDDVVVTYHAQADQLPWAGTFLGHEGFDNFLALVSEHVGIVTADRLDPILSTDHAVVRTVGTWKVHATGAVVTGSMINVFGIRDAQISSYEVWADTAAFVAGMAAQ